MMISREEIVFHGILRQIYIGKVFVEEMSIGCEKCDVHDPRTTVLRKIYFRLFSLFAIFKNIRKRRRHSWHDNINYDDSSSLDSTPESLTCRKAVLTCYILVGAYVSLLL